jgi:hypothetical protein
MYYKLLFVVVQSGDGEQGVREQGGFFLLLETLGERIMYNYR